MRLFRRVHLRMMIGLFLVLGVLVISFTNWNYHFKEPSTPCTNSLQVKEMSVDARVVSTPDYALAYDRSLLEPSASISSARCVPVVVFPAQIDTMETYSQLNFNPEYMQRRDYWDSSLERRYEKLAKDPNRHPLKVIVLPHSHVDAGWLKTYQDYYIHSVRSILDNMVGKLTQHSNMTFIWTEISFFSLWWDSAHPSQRRQVEQLISEGRLEFTSGTWVMADEATTHLYSLIDQMIEGHQWLKTRLGFVPKSVWSVDTFGHGPVMPFLLHSAGLRNTVVQRIHYGWKRWLADRQLSDFSWKMSWRTGSDSILCHNMPFDIYTTKHSCGPDPKTCSAFDFRSINGQYNEFTFSSVPITKHNVKDKADVLFEQYAKIGSMTPHNVVLVLIGDDFRFDHDVEWDQQYFNYQNIFKYIRAHSPNVQIGFGTLSTYFDAVRQRTDTFPTLHGDFFPYSDIFSEGRPAYWTGYFTTRPHLKMLSREVENHLRAAEILYTLSLNRARQNKWEISRRIIDFEYINMVKARRSLALFQHHDAITGTSKAPVVDDYGQKLLEALQMLVAIERRCAAMFLSSDDDQWQRFRLLPTIGRQSYQETGRGVLIELNEPQTIVLYNSDGHFRHEVVRLKIDSPNVRVLDADNLTVKHQINPSWTFASADPRGRNSARRSLTLQHVPGNYQLVFIAPLMPLSLTTFRIQRLAGAKKDSTLIYCTSCGGNNSSSDGDPTGRRADDPFDFHPLDRNSDIQVENAKIQLLVDGKTGFLKSIRQKSSGRTTVCSMQFAAYPSTMFHSGAYLFQPDTSNPNRPYIDVTSHQQPELYIISGPIMSEISVIYQEVVHSTIVFHKAGSVVEQMVLMETSLDMGQAPNYREHEFFIRFKSAIRNIHDSPLNTTAGLPEFFTDMNGFAMARRVQVDTLGVEANYYPITSTAYIQDGMQRLTLLVARAHGFTSFRPGWIEFMLDRRTIHDDGRGMGEGVTDNVPTKTQFILLLEDRDSTSGGGGGGRDHVSQPSLLSHYFSDLLRYPSSVFTVDAAAGDVQPARIAFLNQPLPCNMHLVHLRTLSEPMLADVVAELPSRSALLTVHNRGFDCSVPVRINHCDISSEVDRAFYPDTKWIGLNVASMERTLTSGLKSLGSVVDLGSVRVSPMELCTVNVTFA